MDYQGDKTGDEDLAMRVMHQRVLNIAVRMFNAETDNTGSLNLGTDIHIDDLEGNSIANRGIVESIRSLNRQRRISQEFVREIVESRSMPPRRSSSG
jgi:hypothetical protein